MGRVIREERISWETVVVGVFDKERREGIEVVVLGREGVD